MQLRFFKGLFIALRLATKGLVQRGVWRQAGRCLVGHFTGIWEFASRPSLSETPPERQAPDTLAAMRDDVSSRRQYVKSTVDNVERRLSIMDKLKVILQMTPYFSKKEKYKYQKIGKITDCRINDVIKSY